MGEELLHFKSEMRIRSGLTEQVGYLKNTVLILKILLGLFCIVGHY